MCQNSLSLFTRLHERLTELGYPKIKSKGTLDTFKIDFNNGDSLREAINSGIISFKEDGFVEYRSEKGNYEGYLYMPEYYVNFQNENGIITKKFPKIHTEKCQIITEFILRGNIGRYAWSNERYNNIIDISTPTREVYEKQDLKLCGCCLKMIKNRTNNIIMKHFEIESSSNLCKILMRPDGYIIAWDILSKRVREVRKYTCKKCGIDLQNAKHFCHIHHKDLNKRNNIPKNLQCLCILCHCNVDDNHYRRIRYTRQCNYFVEKFIKELVILKNPYIEENMYDSFYTEIEEDTL